MRIDAFDAGRAALAESSERLARSADRLAHGANAGSRPLRSDAVSAPEKGRRVEARAPRDETPVDVAREWMVQTRARSRFEASLRVIEAARELRGALVDLFG